MYLMILHCWGLSVSNYQGQSLAEVRVRLGLMVTFSCVPGALWGSSRARARGTCGDGGRSAGGPGAWGAWGGASASGAVGNPGGLPTGGLFLFKHCQIVVFACSFVFNCVILIDEHCSRFVISLCLFVRDRMRIKLLVHRPKTTREQLCIN